MHHFFAYMARMKLIRRWSLMQNSVSENIQEHSLQVAQIAHALALIRNRVYGGDVDAGKVLLLAVYHDAEEVITGDFPTPVKYYNPAIKAAYDDMSDAAKQRLLSWLPPELEADYREALFPADCAELELVKAADKIAAYLKCLEEERVGNSEFRQAATGLRQKITDCALPEAEYFMEHFAPSFRLTLDEMAK